MTSAKTVSAAMLALLMGSGLAAAQDQPAPQQVPEQARPPQAAPGEGSSVPGHDSSLSNRLSRSHGVIAPPPTGDQGVMPPPPEGSQSMPVIPPPGSPEGNQRVQPK
jgi:hypothetical protein